MDGRNYGWHSGGGGSGGGSRYFQQSVHDRLSFGGRNQNHNRKGRGGRGGGYGGRGSYYNEDRSTRRGYEEEESNYGEQGGGSYARNRGGYSRGKNPHKEKRSRHPPELKGKAIGLWYAKRGGKAKNYVPVLSMNEDEAHAIDEAIDGLNHGRPVAERAQQGAKPFQPWSIVPTRSNRKFPVADAKHIGTSHDNNDAADSFDHPEVFIAKNEKNPRKDADISELLDRIQDSDFKHAYRANIEGNKLRDQMGFSTLGAAVSPKLVKNPDLDEKMYEELLQKEENALYQKMKKVRQKLPSYQMRDEILNLIKKNQVVVLSGETGCGKTTQVAQFVLDDCILRREGSTCRIVCTQPRRISAISVAERVAEERGEKLGTSVGYQIRLEAVLPRKEGCVLYCTTGIVLQWLQSDHLLSSISHLVLDEIHERDSLSDFLICIAKDLLPLRPDLKVILMSATLNAEHFSKYYNDCPMVHIPGFTYPVKEYFLEDVLKFTGFSFPQNTKRQTPPWKRCKVDPEQNDFENFILPHLRKLESSGEYSPVLLRELRKETSEELNLELTLSLLKYIAEQPPGAVLVFMPGWEKISKLHKMIEEDSFFRPSEFLVIPLHSLMATVNQKEIFNRPPEGVRKIVIATNIAETSITIDDIVYVVDGGRIKMKNYDRKTNISTLLPEWVSMANAKQRRGRAGRVQDGVCYHLYTRAREMLLESYPLPEIQRTRLEEVILQVKSLRLGSCKPFLSRLLDPPEEDVIDVSLKMLQAINALDEEENLTPLGFHLARLPTDPLTGKMLLMAAIFSCVSPVLTVAASLSFKDPFVMVIGKEKLLDRCRRSHAGDTKSDHLMLANVFSQWRKVSAFESQRFLWKNFLSSSVLTQLGNMRLQFMGMLKDAKFVDTKDPEAPALNRNSDNINLVKAVITAGLYPNVARIIKKPRGKFKGHFKGLSLPDVRRAAFHMKSVNEQERMFETSWLVYWEKMKTSKVYLHDTTMISNYPLLLFGQRLDYDPQKKIINVDDFIKIRSDQKVADVIQKLRRELDELLEYKISHPGTTDWSKGSKEGGLLSLIVDILSSEDNTDNDQQIYVEEEDDEEEDDDNINQ